MQDKDVYELMLILHVEPNPPWSDGIDSDPVAHDDALGIIRWLLRNDESIKGYKLVKKPRKMKKT